MPIQKYDVIKKLIYHRLPPPSPLHFLKAECQLSDHNYASGFQTFSCQGPPNMTRRVRGTLALNTYTFFV